MKDQAAGTEKVDATRDDPEDQQKDGVQNGQAARQAELLKEKWGVEILALRLTAHDHMLDFRYKVLDVQKADPLFKRQIKPRLIHAATGKVLDVPVPAKTGALRTSDPPQAGRNYWMFFGNAGGLIKRGDRVTVSIGDFKAENLLVD